MFAAHSISDYQYSDSRDEICEIPNLIRFFLCPIVNTRNSLIKLTGPPITEPALEFYVKIFLCKSNQLELLDAVETDLFYLRGKIYFLLSANLRNIKENVIVVNIIFRRSYEVPSRVLTNN